MRYLPLTPEDRGDITPGTLGGIVEWIGAWQQGFNPYGILVHKCTCIIPCTVLRRLSFSAQVGGRIVTDNNKIRAL